MNIGKLKGIIPDNVLAQLPVIKEIDGPLRMSHFLGQCAHNFRGKGYIQLTGRDNHRPFSTVCGEDCCANPDLVAIKYPLTN